MERFPCYDEQSVRARTLILDVLFNKSKHEVTVLKDTLEDIIYHAEEVKHNSVSEQGTSVREQHFFKMTREFIREQQKLI